jgi:ribosomal-protein-alanine N-acetyltransferase
MAASAPTLTVEPLSCTDVVSVAQCIAIDADAFPYASAQFGLLTASSRVWIAREDGDGRRVVGFVAAQVRSGALNLGGLAVDERRRRRGIGRRLVREAVEYARTERLRAVALHVSVANRAAIALYDAEGFNVVRRLRGFYPPAAFGGEADAYEMALLVARARTGHP